LKNYYEVIFSLAQHHKYSINEIENLMPFERDVYVNLLLKFLEEVEKQKKNSG
jgi:hypothetical protein